MISGEDDRGYLKTLRLLLEAKRVELGKMNSDWGSHIEKAHGGNYGYGCHRCYHFQLDTEHLDREINDLEKL